MEKTYYKTLVTKWKNNKRDLRIVRVRVIIWKWSSPEDAQAYQNTITASLKRSVLTTGYRT